MKSILVFLLSLVSVFATAQTGNDKTIVPRSGSGLTVRDQSVFINHLLKMPVHSDTTQATYWLSGNDSLGAMFQRRATGEVFFRDTSAGAHKWSKFGTPGSAAAWGAITGTITSQADLMALLATYQPLIALGTVNQYLAGDLSLHTVKTDLGDFANAAGYVTSLNGTNSITGNGTSGTPFQLVNDAASPGANKSYSTNSGGVKGWYTAASGGVASKNTPNTVIGYLNDSTQGLYTAGNNVTIAGGQISAANNPLVDSLLLYPQNTFFSTDSILAIGHSIVFGIGAGVPDSAFAKIFGDYYRRGVANYGITGSSITSVVQQDYQRSGSGVHRSTLAMGALNTLRSPNPLGADRTYQKVIGGYAAIILNQFSANNFPANGSAPVNRYGTWSTLANTANGAKTSTVSWTNTLNDSVTYSFTDSTVGVAMLGGDSSGTIYNCGMVSVYIDNVLNRTIRTSGQSDGVADAATAALDGHLSPMAVIIRGLSYGPHKIKLVNTQSGKYMYVDYFANLQNNHSTNPIVLMHDPYMNLTGWANSGGYGGITRNGVIDTANAKLDSLALTMAPYRVYVGKTEKYYQATGSDIGGDGIHPSNSGHRELAQAAKYATDSTHIPGRLEFTNGYAYLNGLGGREEKIYTNVNLKGTNGVQLSDTAVKLNPLIWYIDPRTYGSSRGGSVGMNSPYTSTGINHALSIYSPITSSANILELGGVGNGSNLTFSQSNTSYGFIGIGQAVPFIGATGQYNDISMMAYGNFNLYANGGLIQSLNGSFKTAVGFGYNVTEGTNGRLGQVALVAGTKAITITGLTTSSRAFVQLVSQSSAALTVNYIAVCTANTLTISAVTSAGNNTVNTADVSTLNYEIHN